MNAPATVKTWIFPADPGEGSPVRNVLSLLLGAGFTLGLFLGIAYYEKGAPVSPPAELADLRVSVVPMSPPPVPLVPPEPVPEIVPLLGFEFAPTDSAVSIAVSPPDLARLLPEDLSKASPSVQLGPLHADYKPRISSIVDPQHVYQKSEVDKAPTVLVRNDPSVPREVRDGANLLRVTIIVVINTDGSIGSARLATTSGNEKFDVLMVENIKEWVFSPAIKGGKNVRCLVQQGITVRWTAGSPFEL